MPAGVFGILDACGGRGESCIHLRCPVAPSVAPFAPWGFDDWQLEEEGRTAPVGGCGLRGLWGLRRADDGGFGGMAARVIQGAEGRWRRRWPGLATFSVLMGTRGLTGGDVALFT